MAEIKKYNYTKRQFLRYGSSHARGIQTQVSRLLQDAEQAISVETALSRISDQLATLFGNVAWLAKYGGGGSGGQGGGGGSIVEATGTLLVNGLPTGSQVVMNSDGLEIRLDNLSVALTKSWIVTVTVGSTQIATSSLSYVNNVMYIPADRISRVLVNHQGRLQITASYADDANAIYGNELWTGNILESTVSVEVDDDSSTLEEIRSKQLIINYSVGYLGDSSKDNYRLSIVATKNGQVVSEYQENIRIVETTPQTKALPVFNNIIKSSTNEAIGVYRLLVTLTNIENPALTNSDTANFTLASQNILIATSSMSSNQDSPQDVSLTGSLLVEFTAYVQSLVSFVYDIRIGGTLVVENASGRFGVQEIATLSVSSKPWAIENVTTPVQITVRSGELTASETYYVKFVDSGDSFLTMRESAKTHMISSLRALDFNSGTREFSFLNADYVRGGSTTSLTSRMSAINKNDLSVIRNKANGMPFLRLSNGAALKAEGWKFTMNGQEYNYNLSDFFPDNPQAINEFTISICFKADYHADDYRTVLFCGTLDTTTEEISTGISIDAHNIYINNESVYELSDNTVNMVDITCTRTTTMQKNSQGDLVEVLTYIIKVYVDGVVTATRSLTTGFPNLGDYVYLGCRHYKNGNEDVYTYLCDCEIYNFQVYDRALTDYDIMINRANNLALTSFVSNHPNYSLIDAELRKNFCERNADGTINSHLYDPDSNTYTVDFLMGTQGGLTVLNEQNLRDYAAALGIPIMFIDVSTDPNWTFAAFSAQQTSGAVSLPATQGRRLQYWDPLGDNTNVITLNDMEIELQGTSTLADFMKNLNITAPDDTVFIPKASWLFEKTYTLKADVVDSSHACNASFGKFINEKFGYNPETESSYLPLPADAIANVYNTNYHRDQQPTGSIKHTVEGFPVLLIMKFYVTESSTVSVTPLGIYSFNLGRNAYHNLGFKRINSIQVNGETPTISTFPYAAENAVIDETDGNANWIEIKDTTSIQDLVDVKTALPEGFDSSHGDFWQNDNNIMNSRYEVRFPAGRSVSEYAKFKEFVTNIMRLPIEGCFSTNSLGDVTKPRIADAFDLYTCQSDGTNYEPTGETFAMSVDPNDFTSNLGFNLDSFLRYFCIGQLGGAADNFGKNMTFRSWNNGDYYAGFYDLDCLFGGGNQGLLDISYDMWMKYLYNAQDGGNVYGYMAETFNREEALSDTVFSANHNKLWLSLDTNIARTVFSRNVGSLYTQTWYELRGMLDTFASAAGYKTFWDYYVEEYFKKQTGECGPLLFNYDYKLKYFLQFTDDSYKDTKALTKLHGRKIAYTRTWLKRRITFLDSVFYWRDNAQTITFRNDVNSRGANSVYTTPPAFPIKTNTSLVMYHSVGDQTKTYYFMKKNRKTWVNTANSASDSVLNWNFSHSPNIIELGDENVKLKDMNVANLSYQANALNIDYVGYPSITDLDFSQNTRFNGFTLGAFKPIAAAGEVYDRAPISELRVLDFSNTSGASFPLDLTYIASGQEDTWFQKLYKIDISGSTCVSDLSIPQIPLLELSVAGSSIISFNLKNQAYLPEVDLTGCSRLQTINLDNCGGYQNFSISNLNNLTSCSIVDCENLETITINSCGVLNKLNIENCPKLRSIIVNGCPALVGGSDGRALTIQDCVMLQSISLRNCINLQTFRIANANQAGITTLNLSSTKVSYISGDVADTSLLDLKAFTDLTSFSIGGNSAVVAIQFMNEALRSAIPLANTFDGCSNLERIYGKVSLNAAGLFNNCQKFSVHGTVNPTYFGQAVKVNGVTKLPSAISASDFQTGDRVTNIEIVTTNLSNTFKQTSCTTFDIYYILEKAYNVTNISECFRDLKVVPFSWGLNGDDSPNRNMFARATHLSNIAGAFRQSGAGLIRIFSPDITFNDQDEPTGQNNGLFSPLVETLSGFSTVFYGYSYIIDRRCFRHTEHDYSLVTSMSYFSPAAVVENVNTLSLTDAASGVKAYILNNKDTAGNMAGFFDQLPNVSSMYEVFNSVRYINYDTLGNIPGTSFRYAFLSTYGKGSLSGIASLFKAPATVREIVDAFRVTRQLTDGTNTLKVNVTLSDTFLTGMSGLMYLGYNDEDLYTPKSNSLNSSFGGYGMNKEIQGASFPYRILDSCPNLVMCAGLFDGAYGSSLTENPALPGSMFRNTPNINNVSALFHNVHFTYTLTSRSFASCTGLKKAAYTFAATDELSGPDTTSSDAGSTGRRNYGTGSIPFELFYHGESNEAKSYEGIVGTVTSEVLSDANGQYTRYTIVKPVGGVTTYYCEVRRNSVTWLNDQEETITKSAVLDSNSFVCRKVNATITDMQCCFNRANFSAYEKPDLTTGELVEVNPDYQTFNWIFKDNTFQQVVQDTDYFTEQWSYDGSSAPIETYSSKTVKNMDAPNDGVVPTIYDVSSDGNSGGTLHYCCAPDLLRYCDATKEVNVTGLFKDGGHDVASSVWGNTFSRGGYGLRGRIPSVLLLPFKNASRTLKLDYMFYNCKVLSYYTYNGRSYMIPQTFFTHCPKIASMVYTFAGMTFNRDIQLAVFTPINSSGLGDINHIFYMCYYSNTSASAKADLTGVFSTLRNLTNLSWAFAATYSANNDSVKQTNPYLTFSAVFPSNVYNRAAYSENMNYSYAFAYFQGNVTHEATKTLLDNNTTKNYILYGQS